MAISAGVINQNAILKELYPNDEYMVDLVYKDQPTLALMPKDESPSGFAGELLARTSK